MTQDQLRVISKNSRQLYLRAGMILLLGALICVGCTNEQTQNNSVNTTPANTQAGVTATPQQTPCPKNCVCKGPLEKDGSCLHGCDCPGIIDQPIIVTGGSTEIDLGKGNYQPNGTVNGVSRHTGTGIQIKGLEIAPIDAQGIPGTGVPCQVPANGKFSIIIHPKRPKGADSPITIQGDSNTKTVDVLFDGTEYVSSGNKKHSNPNNKIKDPVDILDSAGSIIRQCEVPPNGKCRITVNAN